MVKLIMMQSVCTLWRKKDGPDSCMWDEEEVLEEPNSLLLVGVRWRWDERENNASEPTITTPCAMVVAGEENGCW